MIRKTYILLKKSGFKASKIVTLFVFSLLAVILDLMGLSLIVPLLSGESLGFDFSFFKYNEISKKNLCFLLFIVIIVRAIIMYICNRKILVYCFSFQKNLCDLILKYAIQSHSFTTGKLRSTTIVKYIINDSSLITNSLIRNIFVCIVEFIIIIFLLGIIIVKLDNLQFIIIISSLAASAIFAIGLSFYSKIIGRRRQKIDKERQQYMGSIIDNGSELVITGKTDEFINLFSNKNEYYKKCEIDFGSTTILPRMFIEFFLMIGFVMYAFSLDINSQSSTTQFAILCFCGLRLIPSLQKCSISMMQIGLCNKPLVDLCSLFETIKLPAYRSLNSQNKITDIILKKQNFDLKYAKINYIIEDEIRIRSGRATFITGESGVGKSLFVKTLIGSHEEISHHITSSNTRTYEKIHDYKIGYVSQKSVLFDSSIGSNIVFSNKKDVIEQNVNLIKSLLSQVGLEQFSSFDNLGIFYEVGESGKKLSGGQKQKLLIARTLFTKPQLLVLDEVTSGLDANNARKINEIIHQIAKTIPVIVIAHNMESYTNPFEQIKIELVNKSRIISKI